MFWHLDPYRAEKTDSFLSQGQFCESERIRGAEICLSISLSVTITVPLCTSREINKDKNKNRTWKFSILLRSTYWIWLMLNILDIFSIEISEHCIFTFSILRDLTSFHLCPKITNRQQFTSKNKYILNIIKKIVTKANKTKHSKRKITVVMASKKPFLTSQIFPVRKRLIYL